MTRTLYMGIDPGKTTGIATYVHDQNEGKVMRKTLLGHTQYRDIEVLRLGQIPAEVCKLVLYLDTFDAFCVFIEGFRGRGLSNTDDTMEFSRMWIYGLHTLCAYRNMADPDTVRTVRTQGADIKGMSAMRKHEADMRNRGMRSKEYAHQRDAGMHLLYGMRKLHIVRSN